jgi:N-6 DNA Methylase
LIDRVLLLHDLQRELGALQPDLMVRIEEDVELEASLRREHAAAVEGQRTAAGYDEWLRAQATQAAVAWLLGCVFVRFCEDNRLVRPVWLAGPPNRRREAVEAHDAHFQANFRDNDRDWLLAAFRHLRAVKPTAQIFDRRNPLWRIQPSADSAQRLVTFWRRTREDGELIHDFTDESLDTRFLGDLYQDLSEDARKRYALLQTPEFVEEFILDRTLKRAVEERGIQGLKLIDPACGSGHFLLGAFRRLLAEWDRAAPGEPPRVRVQKVLDSLYGVDVNPFAVAIAEFRLAVAAIRGSGDASFEPGPDYKYHLAVGDSLLFSGQDSFEFAYEAEDPVALRKILTLGAYDVAVANPPYITVSDRAQNARYRKTYDACSGKYAMSVPFCQLLFELAADGGWVGQITSNSFMKREFGKKLIEQFIARQDLIEVIDTSGAYIPGHGTPTVILVGRHRGPRGQTVRGVLGIRGEPGVPPDPPNGLVWCSIVENLGLPGTETPYVSVVDLPRALLRTYPWALSGGGAVELKEAIESSAGRLLESVASELGITSVTGEDDVYVWPDAGLTARHPRLPSTRLVIGDALRDWIDEGSERAVWTYGNDYQVLSLDDIPEVRKYLWTARSVISRRRRFGTPMLDRGLTWYEWQELYSSKLKTPLTVAYAEVATHNHFVLDRGGKVFNRTAPVIKLPEPATEDDYLGLLGLLNSSSACFWLKQVCFDKGGSGIGRGIQDEDWEPRYAFNATRLERFPLPKDVPLDYARGLDAYAQQFHATTAAAVCAEATPTRAGLTAAHVRWDDIRAQMIALQEELDWQVYGFYGLLDSEDDLTYQGCDLPRLNLGERAFEISLARRVEAGEEETAWFERHGSTPLTDVPCDWPAAYKELVARRLACIAERRDIALIERPECKRRWATEPWEKQEQVALRAWLLDRLEHPALWRDRQGQFQARSAEQLADALAVDAEFLSVLQLFLGRADLHLAAELVKLMTPESVPYLAALRYRDTGLRKRREWESVWDLQRREDRGERVGPIPVPPRYASADFASNGVWRHRGKLDVPKERFISYPGAERDGSPSPIFGWAGWDHLQQAMALATVALDRRQRDGWPPIRLTPLLAGLAELEPWLHQWHGEPDPRFSGSPAAYLTGILDQQLRELRLTRPSLAEWRPERRGRGRRIAVPTAEESAE